MQSTQIRKIILLIISTLLITSNLYADPKQFISSLTSDASKVLASNESKDQKMVKLVELAEANVDIKGIGLYTLGSARKNLSQETLNDFNSVFEVYFLKNLTARLSDYSSQKFETLEAEQKSALYTIVKSKISGGKFEHVRRRT